MCLAQLATPIFYLIVLGIFIAFVLAFGKRNKQLYANYLNHQREIQKEMMDRQRESLEVLKEIRDLLKDNHA